MRLAPLVHRLRASKTRFGNNVLGSADLARAIEATLMKEMAFVIPLTEKAEKSKLENAIDQNMIERFGVVVALQNDTSQADKTGLTAYDSLHDARSEIFEALLNVRMSNTESSIYYVGGSLLEMTPNYLWYQFEFEYEVRIVSNTEGIANIVEVLIYEKDDYTRVRTSEQQDFNKMYTNYILSPSVRLPHEGDLPLSDGYPDVLLPDDMAQLFDFTKALHPGGFSRGFGSAFEVDIE